MITGLGAFTLENACFRHRDGDHRGRPGPMRSRPQLWTIFAVRTYGSGRVT